MDEVFQAQLDLLRSTDFYNLRGLILDMDSHFQKNPTGRYHLNFQQIRFGNVSMLLMFRAWLQGVQDRCPDAVIQGDFGEDQNWLSLYRKFGFLRVVRSVKRLAIQDDKNLIIRYCAESEVRNLYNPEPRLSYDVVSLIPEVPGGTGNDVKNILGAAINEAIHNVKNWAYDSFADVKHCRWWVAGVFNRSINELSIFVYDVGVGIPQRFKENRVDKLGLMSSFLDLDKESSDNEVLLAAMKLHAENARQLIPDGRCRGLQQMRMMTASFSPGSFNVYSGNAEYHMLCLNGRVARCSALPPPSIEAKSRLKKPILHVPGTLISWTLRVPNE